MRVHAISGHGYDLALLVQRADDAHLLLREHPGEDDLRRVERDLELDVGKVAELLAGDDDGRGGAHQADLTSDRRRGVRVIAGDHDHLDARLAAFLERVGDFRTRGIFESDESGEGHLRFRIRQFESRGQLAPREREHAQALLGHGFGRSAKGGGQIV